MDNTENNKIENYKEAKDFGEMISYLKDDKNVIYVEMSEIEAAEILEKYNYINVITPFKHKFALKNKNDEVEKPNGKHIYPHPVDFKEYYDEYIGERSKYPTIIANILEFESHFKSAITHAVLVERSEKISNSDELISFLKTLQMRLAFTSYKEKRKTTMIEQIDNLIKNVLTYPNVFCFFDRISLGTLLTIYIGLDEVLQNSVFKRLKKYNMHLNAEQVPHFISKAFALVDIRNCVMHCNSLEVLTRFYNTKEKTLRRDKNKKLYLSMVEYLEKEK